MSYNKNITRSKLKNLNFMEELNQNQNPTQETQESKSTQPKMSEKLQKVSLKKNTSWLWIIVAVVVVLAIVLLAM